MQTPSQQNARQTVTTKHKQPVAQLMTLTLSLVGYGVINQRAFAANTLVCPVSEDTQITDPTDNNQLCVINATTTSTGAPLTLSVLNSTLTNYSGGQLINYGKIWNTNVNNYSTLPPQSNLVNQGQLYNYADVLNQSDFGISNLTNTAGASLINDGYLINTSSNGGTSTLTNSGTLTNNSYLYNESYGAGSTSSLTNAAGASLTNDGDIFNISYAGSTSILTNSGTLTNNEVLLNSSYDLGSSSLLTNNSGASLINEGVLVNYSYDGATANLTNNGTLTNNDYLFNDATGLDSTSTLTNGTGASLTNNDYLYNKSYEGGTSNLSNSGTLINNNYLYNESDGVGSTSTLTNTAGASLTNDGYLDNKSYIGGTSTLSNSGTLINNDYLYNESTGTGSYSNLTNNAGASLNNEGYLYNRSFSGGNSTLTNSGVLVNNGSLYNEASGNGSISTLNNSGSLTNNGYLYNDAKINNQGTFDITTSGQLYNQGSFVQTAGSTVVNGEIYGSGSIDIQGGSLSGSGSIEASTIIIGENATVSAGNSPGTLILSADVDWSGTLNTEIMSSTVYDMLEVQGRLSLEDTSTFEFTFDSSYVAVDGHAFDFLSAFEFDFGLGADFASWYDPNQFSVSGLAAGFDWSVSFTDNFANSNASFMWLNVFADGLASKPVSAPSTLVMFGLTLSLMGWKNRRRINSPAHSA